MNFLNKKLISDLIPETFSYEPFNIYIYTVYGHREISYMEINYKDFTFLLEPSVESGTHKVKCCIKTRMIKGQIAINGCVEGMILGNKIFNERYNTIDSVYYKFNGPIYWTIESLFSPINEWYNVVYLNRVQYNEILNLETMYGTIKGK